jgi:hypothetical protein
MRRLAISLVLAFALAPAAAVAKEPVSAKVCGASDCRTVTDRQALMALIEGGGPTDPPKGGTGWYEVVMTIEVDRDRHETFPLAIVPSEGVMRGGDEEAGYNWMTVTDAGAREYRRVTRGIAPFSPSSLEGLGRPEAKVDEVVLPPAEPKADGGGSSALPWIAGGLVLLGLAGALLRWRGLPVRRSQPG